MRALRAALDKAEAMASTSALHGVPSSPALLESSAGGRSEWPTLEARSRDDSAAVGNWVARRLAQQAFDEKVLQDATKAPQTGAPVDLASWSVDDVSEWLRTTVRFDAEQVEALRAQGISGVELTTLDELDLRVLGVVDLPQRKRILRQLHDLRARARREVPSGALSEQKLARQLEARRRRLQVLGECTAKVLATTPAIPLRTRRLLTQLWQQAEDVGLDALAQIDLNSKVHRQREAEQAERAQRACRRRLEAQMCACAEAEDMLHETQELLRLERAKLDTLRASMNIENSLRKGKGETWSPERAFSHEMVNLLVPSDFSVHEISPPELSSSFVRMSTDLEELVHTAEHDWYSADMELSHAETVIRDLDVESSHDAKRVQRLRAISASREHARERERQRKIAEAAAAAAAAAAAELGAALAACAPAAAPAAVAPKKPKR